MIAITYRRALSVRWVRWLIVAGTIARLSLGIVPFAILVLIVRRAGFLDAGAVSAIYLLVTALTGPWRGRVVDRAGFRLGVAGFAVIYAWALVGLSLIGIHGGALPLALVLVLVAAVTTPPASSALRTCWSRLMPEDDHIRTMNAFDSVLEEATFVVAPMISGGIVLTAGPRVALGVGAVVMLVGCILLWLVAMAAGIGSGGRAAHVPPGTRAGRTRGLLRTRSGLGIVSPIFGLGLGLGGLGLIVTAKAAEAGSIGLAGIILGGASAGGVVGGLIFGRLRVARGLAEVYALLGLWLAAAIAVLAAPVGLFGTGLVVVVAGLVETPLFTVAYVLVPKLLPKERATEGNVWIGSGFNFGAGVGAVVAGAAIVTVGDLTAVVVGGVCAVCSGISLALIRTRRGSAEPVALS